MKKLVLSIIFLITSNAFADLTQVGIFKSDEDFNYPDYYRVKEDPRLQFINLLVFDHINEKFPMPAVPYNRDSQFGGWLRDTTDGTCLNTRGKVLVRDSSTNVSYAPNGCTVDTGTWNDHYTARLHTNAKDIQIDHVVALKNAYMTGAHEWDFKKRCLYANYLGNSFHLLSVSGKENLKKSDSTPSGYVPPNKEFVCEFVKDWLNIKLIWSLRSTPKEQKAIMAIVTESQCNPQTFIVTSGDLKAQRDFMLNNADLCGATAAVFETF